MPAHRNQCRTVACLLLIIVASATGSGQSYAPRDSERGLASLSISVDPTSDERAVPPTLTLLLQPLSRGTDTIRIMFNPASAFEVRIAPGRYQVSSERVVRWGSHWVMWDLEVPVTDRVNELHLSAQNAITFNWRPEGDAASTAMASASKPGSKATTSLARRASVATSSGSRAKVTARPGRPDTKSGPAYIPPPIDLSSPATPLEAAIVNVLEKWVRAVQQRDLEMLMSCYGPNLSRYFLQKNVSWDQVKLDKQRFFRKFLEIRKLEIRDVRISQKPRGAEARLTKSWDFGGEMDFSGEVVSHLIFENHNGQWLISAERESEIWVRRLVDQSTLANE
jgi:hypothetical protein